MPKTEHIARAAGKAASTAAREWMPSARHSGKFVRHVLPAAFKPVHSLWHEILAFLFLVVAGLIAWKIWRSNGSIAPAPLVMYILFALVLAGYGISSWRKARRISRS